MHFEVEHRRRTGLRVVPRLDVQRLTRLEGYNGIGKSVLIRLLQVCVGQHPYPNDKTLWESFRAGVGQARVHLSDIEGASTIEWILDADRWREEGEHVTGIDHLTIDGHSATLGDVEQLLAVHTILGNENLTNTLSRRLGVHRSAMAVAAGPDSILQQRLIAMDEVLQPLASMLERTSGLDLEPVVSQERLIRQALQSASDKAISAQQRLNAVEAVLLLAAQLADVEKGGGDLDAEIAVQDKTMADIDQQLERLASDLATASKTSAASEASRRKLQRAQQQASRAENRCKDALVEVKALAAEAGLTAVTATKISQEQSRTQEALDKALAQLASVHTAPEVADLADDLSERLKQAEDAGLSDETLLHDPPIDATFTVSQLRLALSARSQQLRASPPSDSAARLQVTVQKYRDRLGVLTRLVVAADAHSEADRKADHARQRLTEAAEQVTSAVDHDDLAELMEQRRKLTEKLRDTAVERADLVRARNSLGGGASADELSSQLSVALAQANLDMAELTTTHATAVAAHKDAAGRVASLGGEHRAAQTRLDEVRRELARVVHLLAEGPQFAWVRSCASSLLPNLDADAEVQKSLIWQLHQVVEGLRNRIDRLREQLRTVNEALRVAQEELRGGSVHSSDLVSSVRSWFSDEVSGWFNQPQLLDTIFQSGHDVHVDLHDKTVRWQIEDIVMSRPLEAFSSGERAFAYTRAQLALLDGAPAPANRLVVLDEFGAFIAREWQHRLVHYLTDHAQRNPADSMVLVLPLTRTEAELRDSGHADDALAQLSKLPYFTHTLLPRRRR